MQWHPLQVVSRVDQTALRIFVNFNDNLSVQVTKIVLSHKPVVYKRLMTSPKVLFTSRIPIRHRPTRSAHNSAFNVCNELSRHKIQYFSFNSSLVDHITSHPRLLCYPETSFTIVPPPTVCTFFMQLISFQSVLKRQKLVFYFCTSYS